MITRELANSFIDRLVAESGPDSKLEAELVWACEGDAATIFGPFTTSTDEAARFAIRLIGSGAALTSFHAAVAASWAAAKNLHKDDWPQWLPRMLVAQALHVATYTSPSFKPKPTPSKSTLDDLDLDL